MKRFSAVLIILAITILGFFFFIPNFKQLLRQESWKERTTPLPKETIDLLCHSFELSPDDSLCNGRGEVYGLDFFDIIRDAFRPYMEYEIVSSEAATYDDVEKKIGMFRYECEPVVQEADGFTYFVCFYDLRGDRAFIIAIVYSYPDMAVWRMNSTSRLGD